jgi:predicted phosphodiesterase
MEAMLQGDAKTRRTRFVCVSDTHNAIPGGAFQLPKGDVLIHAGDMTNQGTYMELKKALKWIEEADFEAKIVIAGRPLLKEMNKETEMVDRQS